MSGKYVIAMNEGGISNRLKCLISLWRIADLTKRDVLIYWPKNSVCGANFNDLFENNFKEISKKDLYDLKKKDYQSYNTDKVIINNTNKKFLISSTCRWTFLIKDYLAKFLPKSKWGIDALGYEKNHEYVFDKLNPEIKKILTNYLKKIIPEKSVRKKIEEFDKKNKIKDCVGLHVRRGDYLAGKDKIGFVSRDEEFLKRMNELLKENPKERFFLCTDSEEMEKKFKELFGNKIIIFPKTNFDREDVIFTQDGLIDLLLLSKTKRILGTYGSSFTEMAWWLGGCKPKMEIMVNENNLKRYIKNFKKRERSVAGKLKKIIAVVVGKAPKFR